MRPASPPASLVDMIEVQQQRKSSRQFKRQSLVKQSSMDDQEPGAGGVAAGAAGVPEQTNIDPTELPDGMPDEHPMYVHSCRRALHCYNLFLEYYSLMSSNEFCTSD